MIMLLILQALIFFFLHPNIESLKTAFENKVMNLIENAGESFALQSLQEKVSKKPYLSQSEPTSLWSHEVGNPE